MQPAGNALTGRTTLRGADPVDRSGSKAAASCSNFRERLFRPRRHTDPRSDQSAGGRLGTTGKGGKPWKEKPRWRQMVAEVFFRSKKILCAARHFYVPCNTQCNPRLRRRSAPADPRCPASRLSSKQAHV